MRRSVADLMRAMNCYYSNLIEKRLLVSGSHKAPLRLGFPIDVIERWFPMLYPTT